MLKNLQKYDSQAQGVINELKANVINFNFPLEVQAIVDLRAPEHRGFLKKIDQE